MLKDLAIFLPCRSGSTRVHRKNTRTFAGRDDGLLGVKLDHLERLEFPARVILDSNDPECLRIGEARQQTWRSESELIVRERPDHLGQSSTTTDELISYALETIEADDLLWTHVTSPLVDESVYHSAIQQYVLRNQDLYDSLMTVTRIPGFLWTADGPLNYRPEPLKWPRTQDLPPVYEVNSAIFFVPMTTARSCRDRIGVSPLLMPLDESTAADIDEESDFYHAEQLYGEMSLTS